TRATDLHSGHGALAGPRAEARRAGHHRDRSAGPAARGGPRHLPPPRRAARLGEVLARPPPPARGSRVIAADTSSMIAFLEGDDGDDVGLLPAAIHHPQPAPPPAVPTHP